MSLLNELRKSLKGLRRGGEHALRDSFSTAASFFKGGSKNASQTAFFRLLTFLFYDCGLFSAQGERLFRKVMSDLVPDINADQTWSALQEAPVCHSEAEVLEALELLPDEKKFRLIHFAAAMCHRSDGMAEGAEKLENIALKAGMEQDLLKEIISEIIKAQERRERILRSGAGIAAALIVIAVFILTATLLRSVIFGLIFAYLLLPLEQFLEKNWREKRGPGFYLGKAAGLFCWLPRTLASVLKRRNKDEQPTPEQIAKKEEQKIIARAVGQTFFVFLTAALIFVGGVYALSSYYLRGIGEQMRPSAELKGTPVQQTPGKNFSAADELKKIRAKLIEVPFLKYVIEKTEASLHDEKTRQELASMVWRRSGGVFSFLFNVMGFVGTLICDLLLTVFFGLLFLMKMAEFKNSGRGGGGNYAVKTILVSNWMPDVSESTISEAQRILSGVFSRLRIWVRGYLTLVFIDSTVYTVLFGILDVPFFPVLGIIAGCGILLPYVGPIFSCCLTLLVTYLAGDAGVSQLVLILCCYLIYNGIIEQFILYPMVIGESLGLTTLETIIVVLLGAIFAGIAGMILALPAASVIKYLVPQIYRCWDLLMSRRKDASGSPV